MSFTILLIGEMKICDVMQLFYRLVYNKTLNIFFRNLNKVICYLFPIRFRLPPSGRLLFKIEKDANLVLLTNQTSYLTHLLYWHGGITKFEYSSIFISLIKNVGVFYDIGANIGYYSLIANILNPTIKVVAFEPALGSLHFLRRNIKENNLLNIRVESIALSNQENGKLTFYEVQNKKYKYLKHNLAGESNAGSKTFGRDFLKSEVYTTTLDKYVLENYDCVIDLIKLDTEGTENLILENAAYVLSKHKPILICEVLFGFIEEQLELVLKKYGYEFYGHINDGLVKLNTLVRKEDDGVRNCFFVPPSKRNLVEEFIIRN